MLMAGAHQCCLVVVVVAGRFLSWYGRGGRGAGDHIPHTTNTQPPPTTTSTAPHHTSAQEQQATRGKDCAPERMDHTMHSYYFDVVIVVTSYWLLTITVVDKKFRTQFL